MKQINFVKTALMIILVGFLILVLSLTILHHTIKYTESFTITDKDLVISYDGDDKMYEYYIYSEDAVFKVPSGVYDIISIGKTYKITYKGFKPKYCGKDILKIVEVN